jgi:hypothetical protein
MTDNSETERENGDPEESHALVLHPLTDERDVAVALVCDAVRVARGEMSDVAFSEKYRGKFEDSDRLDRETR